MYRSAASIWPRSSAGFRCNQKQPVRTGSLSLPRSVRPSVPRARSLPRTHTRSLFPRNQCRNGLLRVDLTRGYHAASAAHASLQRPLPARPVPKDERKSSQRRTHEISEKNARKTREKAWGKWRTCDGSGSGSGIPRLRGVLQPHAMFQKDPDITCSGGMLVT